ncbi:hypothetical protein SAY86_019563 [Trapa natans]|uniref:Uncharacterized protein n=1 Tax=Trapa natans TaxID=22666 RepID=A0AAN7LND3_TRANT|nr:hypothetical protein SAY86_019563 [Trapa natans]
MNFENDILNVCRWSRIAHKLPGRTDNEIKNYWRTYMRKKAQEKRRTMSLPSFSNFVASNEPNKDSLPSKEFGRETFCGIGGPEISASGKNKTNEEEEKIDHTIDDIWPEIALSEENAISPAYECYRKEVYDLFCPPIVTPSWEYCADSLGSIHDEVFKMFPPAEICYTPTMKMQDLQVANQSFTHQ